MRMFLIDVTISKVIVPVNHMEVQMHWLFVTQDASVFSWGELWKVRRCLINTVEVELLAQSWFIHKTWTLEPAGLNELDVFHL